MQEMGKKREQDNQKYENLQNEFQQINAELEKCQDLLNVSK